jgi:hypothetical protein
MSDQRISNYPKEFSMGSIRSKFNAQYGQPAKNCRFAVVITPPLIFGALGKNTTVAQDLTYMCESAEMPGRAFLNVDLRHYGPSFKLPFQSKYEDSNMVFICRSKTYERQFFDDWLSAINPVDSFDFNYRNEYSTSIRIFQLSEEASETRSSQFIGRSDAVPDANYAFTLHNAYPILVNPQPHTWADDQITRLGITFTYTWWTREGLDPNPGTTQSGNNLVLPGLA